MAGARPMGRDERRYPNVTAKRTAFGCGYPPVDLVGSAAVRADRGRRSVDQVPAEGHDDRMGGVVVDSQDRVTPAEQRGKNFVLTNCSRCHAIDKVSPSPLKIAPPFRAAEFDIMFNEGISKLGEIIDIGVEKNIIEKSGAWFSYAGTRIGQGRENVKQFLHEHQDMASEIEQKVRQASGLPGGAAVAAAASTKEKEPAAERGAKAPKGPKSEKLVEA